MQEPWQPHLPPGPCPRNVNKVVGGKFSRLAPSQKPLFLPEDLEASPSLHLCDLGKTPVLGFHPSPTSRPLPEYPSSAPGALPVLCGLGWKGLGKPRLEERWTSSCPLILGVSAFQVGGAGCGPGSLVHLTFCLTLLCSWPHKRVPHLSNPEGACQGLLLARPPTQH